MQSFGFNKSSGSVPVVDLRKQTRGDSSNMDKLHNNADTSNDAEGDSSFFKVISENLKYAFNSPLPTTTQFPTPYSSNQVQQFRQGDLAATMAYNNQQRSENDSSLLENSILPGMPIEQHQPKIGETLDDINIQPSSVLQFATSNNTSRGSNTKNNDDNTNSNINPMLFPNEFLLTSPEQFKDFLLDSPGNLNLFHKTPAKTPLRFVTDNNNGNKYSNSNTGKEGPPLPMQNSMFGYSAQKQVKNDEQTPLRNLDLNLMFNSNHMMMSSSPSKKFPFSLTPYGRKVLNDIGTPYAKTLVTSNSALTDFQKARKDTGSNKLQSTPEASSKNTLLLSSLKKGSVTPQSGSKQSRQLHFTKDTVNSNIPNLQQDDPYGSSPTTIQLNSSVTKSSMKVDSSKIPALSRELLGTNLEGPRFNGSLTLSPTPNPYTSPPLDSLKMPELPKMGSFTSERTLSTISNKSTSNTHTRSNKVKKPSNKKQPKFQIIVSNAQQFGASLGNSNHNGKPKKASNSAGKLKRAKSLVVRGSKISNTSKKSGFKTKDALENGHPQKSLPNSQ